MSQAITVDLPQPIYDQLREVADQQRQSVESLVIQTLTEVYPLLDIHPQRDKMMREVAFFEAHHTELLKQYAGHYIAILNGQVIDNDIDLDTLAIRVEAGFPDEIVLMQLVERVLPPVLRVRSPRLLRER